MPALNEMGMNYSRWYYVLPSDMLIVTAYTAARKTDIILEVTSQKNNTYDFILTNQLVMGENEYSQEIIPVQIPQGLRFTLDSEVYPDLHYDLQVPEVPFEISDDRIFFTDHEPRDETFLTISIKGQSHFQCIINGCLQASSPELKSLYSFEKEKAFYQEFYGQLNRNFYLRSSKESLQTQLAILNQTAWWYSHNAMVHFALGETHQQLGDMQLAKASLYQVLR